MIHLVHSNKLRILKNSLVDQIQINMPSSKDDKSTDRNKQTDSVSEPEKEDE